MKTYAVNSHSGPINTNNENRLSIVTNLNSFKNHTISFFGIYEGKNGMIKAEYMRDNFHLILFNEPLLVTNFEEALKRTLETV